MRKNGLVLCLLISLIGWSFIPLANSQQVQATSEDEVQRPEDYLFYVADMSNELMQKFAGEGLIDKDCLQRKTSDLYIAENTIKWAEYGRIKTQIMVGGPDYWDGFNLRGEESFDWVTQLDNLGDEALLMESGFEDEIRFIKGNSFVEISIVGGETVDIMPIAEKMAAELPQEMPHPDSLELIAPAPVYNIQLPSKYISEVYKSGDPHSFSEWGPDADSMYLVSRYPFTKFTLGVWSVDRNAYELIEQRTLSIYELWVLNAEHNGRAFGLQAGEYELHYWVNGELAANFPFRFVGVNEE